MDKETLSNYGWIVICVLVIAVMVALATPFGNYIKSAVENTTQDLYDTSAGDINSTDLMHIAGQSFEGSAGGSGSAYNHDDPALHPNDGSSPTIGNTYETTDYTYCFGKYWNFNWVDSGMDGWGVKVKDTTKTSYEPILESINNKPVTNMTLTFFGCTSLTTAPTIPENVTNLDSTFSGCTSLTDLSDFVIPNSVTDMENTFQDCTSLTTAPVIPSSVTNMHWTFRFCNSLSGTIEINANPSDYNRCLQGTQISEITGDTTLKDEILQTKYQTGGMH